MPAVTLIALVSAGALIAAADRAAAPVILGGGNPRHEPGSSRARAACRPGRGPSACTAPPRHSGCPARADDLPEQRTASSASPASTRSGPPELQLDARIEERARSSLSRRSATLSPGCGAPPASGAGTSRGPRRAIRRRPPRRRSGARAAPRGEWRTRRVGGLLAIRRMHVAVDGRALRPGTGRARGVARYLRCLLDELAAHSRRTTTRSVDPGRVRLAPAALTGARGWTAWPAAATWHGCPPAPVAVSHGVPLVLTVHDLSFEHRPGDYSLYDRGLAAARPAGPPRAARAARAVRLGGDEARGGGRVGGREGRTRTVLPGRAARRAPAGTRPAGGPR